MGKAENERWRVFDLKHNQRIVMCGIGFLALLITLPFLPVSAQLAQWRSLNPTRDGTLTPGTIGPILYSIHVLSPTAAWAVGGNGGVGLPSCDIYTLPLAAACTSTKGFALFYDGVRWRQVLVPAAARALTSVFAVSPNDVWAVGLGPVGVCLGPTVIHWDGVSWVLVDICATSPGVSNLFSVFMLPSGTDGWAVGDGGAVDNIRWSGTWPGGAWTPGPPPGPNLLPGAPVLRSVSLSSPTFGWIMGSGGQIFKWDGASWSDISATSPVLGFDMLSVFAISGSDAWAVGAADKIIRWNGASWNGPMVAPTTGVSYRSIRMVSASDGWIAGSVNPTSGEGTLLRWNGIAWNVVRSYVTVNLNGLFLLPGGFVGGAVGNAETILYWNGSQWIAQTSPTSTGLRDVYFVAANDGWAVGLMGRILRYDGVSWRHYETLPSGVDLFGLFMRTSNDGWAVGSAPGVGFPPTILRWNGISWSSITPSGVALGQILFDVYMLSATEGWAVGTGIGPAPATILKWDGSIWTSVPSGTSSIPGAALFSVFMLSSTDGWAVGCFPSCAGPLAGPVIVRWNGVAWSLVTAPSGISSLLSVYMLSPTDGWAVGFAAIDGQATIIHWDGAQWRRVPGPIIGASIGHLTDVRMVSPTDGWAVGLDLSAPATPRTLIIHWDGVRWNVVATPPEPPTLAVELDGLFMIDPCDGWAVGGDGIIVHYGPCKVTTTTAIITATTTVSATTTTITSTTISTTPLTTSTTIAPPPTDGTIVLVIILIPILAVLLILLLLFLRPRRRRPVVAWHPVFRGPPPPPYS